MHEERHGYYDRAAAKQSSQRGFNITDDLEQGRDNRPNDENPADKAHLRDDRPVLLFEAANPEDKIVAEKEINALRTSGDLDRIIKSMRLDEDV